MAHEDRYTARLSVDFDMNFSITVRYGGRRQRYHTFRVEADDARAALALAAGEIPDEIAPEADLVELRVAIEPDERSYVE